MSVRLRVDDEFVGTIELDAPPLNLFDVAMRDGLIESLLAARDHPDVRVVVIRPAGAHVSAGADLSEFGRAESPFEARRIRWDRDPWNLLWTMEKPTIAVLKGYALGAGLEMSLLCDFRVAEPTGRLGLPETKVAMLPAAGGTQSLPRAIGTALALPIILTSKTLTAEEALSRGIVHRVEADADSYAQQLARVLALRPSPVLRALKRAVRVAADLPLEQGLEVEKVLASELTN